MKPFRVLDPNLPDRGARGLCALAVMTKAPQAGRVKTRLVPPLTPEEAAELNKCFLRDTAAAISSACSRRPVGDEENAIRTRPALRTAKRLQPHAESPFTRPSALSRPTTIFFRPISVCCRNAAINSVSVSISRSRICSNAVLNRCV